MAALRELSSFPRHHLAGVRFSAARFSARSNLPRKALLECSLGKRTVSHSHVRDRPSLPFCHLGVRELQQLRNSSTTRPRRVVTARASTDETGSDSANGSSNPQAPSVATQKPPSPAESALARARAYADAKKQEAAKPSDSILENSKAATNATPNASPEDVPSIALMQSSAIYQKQKEEMAAAISAQRQIREPAKAPSDMVEVEIVTKDGIIKKQLSRSEMSSWDERVQTSKFGATPAKKPSGGSAKDPSGRPALKVSASDFAGLNFSDQSDRSSRSLPAGLQAAADAPRQLPQVEIITRAASASAAEAAEAEAEAAGQGETGGESDEAYKPKVATWGVFPRPRDISQTYGGGRTLRPGQELETEEQKKAREEKTRRLLDEYSRLVGLKLEPAVKAECQKALDEGNALMDRGKLVDAVEEFTVVITKIPFQNDLHGRAALQKAMCLDSMARNEEAKGMYERLAGHPNPSIKRKAQQMLFGFRAAESLKFSGTSTWSSEWYRTYFDRVSRDAQYNFYKAEDAEENDTLVKDALTYGAVLLMPLVLLLAVIARKNMA